MSIKKHRVAIDKIDTQIVKLLNRRTKHVLDIGQAKLASGKAIFQPDREQALLRRICKLSDGVLPDESLRHIYREVMSSSIALQKGFKIASSDPKLLTLIRRRCFVSEPASLMYRRRPLPRFLARWKKTVLSMGWCRSRTPLREW